MKKTNRIPSDIMHNKVPKTILRRLKSSNPKCIGFRTGEGIRIVQLNDILHCEASGNYCQIHLRNESPILLSKTLKAVSKHLPNSEFIRTHQSHIVQAADIILLNHEITLSNGKKLPLARSKKGDVQQWFEQRVNIV